MHCEPKKFAIAELVSAWRDASLKANSEYQRGASWKKTQMQGLIDSVFRGYPLPPVFLHRITSVGLGGHETIRYEVVDGQQRIRAFAEYLLDKFVLLSPEDKDLRLPNSLRQIPAPWAGRTYSQLDRAERELLDRSSIDAYVLTQIENDDEVRDLFIRLQSGTALNRQQVRDAWPGNLGPFVESLAGKLDREPSMALFGIIDRRSDRGDDDIDRFTVNRQVCGQILALFLARQRDSLAVQSVTADDLDKLYHANTEFDPNGPTAEKFRAILKLASLIFQKAAEIGAGRSKFKKLDVFAIVFLVQDLSANPQFRINEHLIVRIAKFVAEGRTVAKQGKSVSGKAIAEYYEQWHSDLPESLGIRLDSQRLFDPSQKEVIHGRQDGLCGVCSTEVKDGDAEYDHFPTPYYLGGRTDVANGRLVCTKCHPRGRPLSTSLTRALQHYGINAES